jgi:hypothetical protein
VRRRKVGTVTLAENAREAILLDYLRLRANRPENQNAAERLARRGIKAWLLAPNIATYEALMDGQTVPESKLNAKVARRYGRR